MDNRYNEIVEIMKANRSYRRFDESKTIERTELEDIIGVTRFCPSGRNLQPLKYRLVYEKSELDKVFPHLAWAGYLKDWDGPAAGERPTAYLVQCLDTELTENCLCDDGLQIEAITLAAVAKGMGCCIIKSFNPAAVAEILGIPSGMKPLYVVAIGYPVEKVVIEDMKDGDVRYYRDDNSVHHVPKRSLKSILI